MDAIVLRGVPYPDAEARQRSHLDAMARNPDQPGAVLFVEHQPVITCGRSGDGSNLLVDPETLAGNGIAYRRAGRGGDVAYHGPGQWTVYPILRLAWYGKDLHRYLRLLEECAIAFLSRRGIAGTRRKGLTGVWVGRGKVAAVGVAVSRWIAWHGFALNIHPDISHFTAFMHPCGIREEEGSVASLETLTGRRHGMMEVLPDLKASVFEVLSLDAKE
ncbi:MAG: lipoyl(octanoyl) transferase LipB [Planctomycetota bacterium]|nr:lipoyl(octanoyl) transferase LipB [Planctomycetota bacterium]